MTVVKKIVAAVMSCVIIAGSLTGINTKATEDKQYGK